MPRGGSRQGAGRKPDPNSKRQQALAAKAARAAVKKAQDGAAAPAAGMTKPDGRKDLAAPPAWPFGTQEPAPPAPVAEEADDGLTDEQRASLSPLDYLLTVMRSPKASSSARMTAAIQAAPYVHAKVAPAGKREAEAARQKQAAAEGRFSRRQPPKLVAAGGKKVE